MEAAEQVGYSANPVAQSLKLGRSPIVSVIVSHDRESFWGKFVHGIWSEAYRNNFLASVSNTTGPADSVQAVLEHVISQRVAGIILGVPHVPRATLDALARSGIPVVLIDHRLEGCDGDFIALDNRLAIGMLTGLLAGHSHRSIAFVSGPREHWSASERLEGFLDAVADHGLEPDTCKVVNGEWTSKGAYDAVMPLLVGPRRPSAIIASNDQMMIGVLQALQELGIGCPGDISVCCVDGMPWGDVLQPRITHVEQPADDMVAQASAWLYERIRNRGEQIAPRSRLFTPRLVAGDSIRRFV